MKKYKIGLLLDSFLIRAWQYHILDYLVNHPTFEIGLIVINDGKRASQKNTKYAVYKLFIWLDRKIFKTKTNLFSTRDCSDLLKNNKILRVKPKQTKITDEIIGSDLSTIRECRLDILIRFGFKILKGDILSSARYGVWSLHHGDNRVNRGGPPAFWEVVNNEIVTGVTLLKLSSNLDGGSVLGKSYAKTDKTSFHRNQISAFWAGIELFCASLNSFVKDGPEKFFAETKNNYVLGFYSQPLFRNPTNGKAVRIFISFWLRRINELLKDVFLQQQWSIYYYAGSRQLETSLFRYTKLLPPPGIDWADPFVVEYSDAVFIFFEEFVHREKKAHISVLQFSKDGKLESQEPMRVLSEKYHLSYPFITEVEGTLYMIPESASVKKVSLYACVKHPSIWVKKRDILTDVEFFDPTLHFHEGIWYLFGTIKPWEGNSPDQYLAIYYSEDLMNGIWQPHPMNPLSRDVRGSRPAGKIFVHKEKIIRPSQVGAPKYGSAIRFYQIIKLSTTEFAEVVIDDVQPLWEPDLLATHTFNSANEFSVVDVQKWRSKI
ncbi:hypothetical protein [Chryseolinea sp. H1M3-3]|uniref:glucosamine inositolphosphorylceramide transferase family protein n=1 Tax=Chryseolinea sp. H1M3-3 TaxID=3034144 RepID=UPI0023EE266B|nr:hypothetical protein [Chryseolinea sp. H1M3-3]